MPKTALWRAVYTSGHDAAALFETPSGRRLEGTAVFLKDGEPARVAYALDLASDWSTRAGSVRGFVGRRRVRFRIERAEDRWTLNGVPQDQVRHSLDLDFGFTPATNHPQLRRMGLSIGESKEISVAWLDLDSDRLEPLPQLYRRVDDRAYDYDSPQGSYRATLRIASNGFVSEYPDLWEMVAESS
jgi:hypothetical protein